MFTRLCVIPVALALLAGCATPSATRGPDQDSVAPVAPSAPSSTPTPVPDAISSQTQDAPATTKVAPPAPPAPTPIPAPIVNPAPPPAPAPAVVSEPVRPDAPRPVDVVPEKAPVAVTKPRVEAPAPRVVEPKAPVPVVPETQTINGRLELVAGPRQSVTANEITEGLVYFLPTAGAPPPKPGRFTISTQSKGFDPNYLVVPVGSTVAFPNRDTVLHNVYSRTPGSSFELGTFGPGETRQVVLKTAGLVIVNCNVHVSMRANVLVLATPYYTRPAKDGSFSLKDMPVGSGTLVFWHPRASAGSMPIKAGSNTPVVQRLVATKARIETHSAAGH